MLESSRKFQVGPLDALGDTGVEGRSRAGSSSALIPILLGLAPAQPLGSQPHRARLSPHRLVWTPSTSPEAHVVPLCFCLGAGAFSGIPGECPISLARPSLPSQACSSQPWPPHARRCLRASHATRSPLSGCPGALPPRKDWWQPGRRLQVRVCCWLCRTGRFWRSAARCPSGVSHQSS